MFNWTFLVEAVADFDRVRGAREAGIVAYPIASAQCLLQYSQST